MCTKMRLSLVVLFCLFSSTAWCKTVEAPIKNVTVYRSQARVERTTQLNLEKGQYSLVIEDLPLRIDDRSIRVTVKGLAGATVLRMKPKLATSKLAGGQDQDSLRQMIGDLEKVRLRILKDHLNAFKAQKAFLERVTNESSARMSEEITIGAMNVDLWNNAYRFVGARSIEADDSIRVTEQEIERLNGRVQTLKSKLQVTGRVENVSKSVTIDVDLKQAGELTLGLSYEIDGAGWTPLYDARLNRNGDSVQFAYMADVRQTTGESWKDVTLTLSTSSPESGAGPGELMPRYLSVAAPRYENQVNELSGVISVHGRQDVLDKFVTDSRVNVNQQAIKSRPVQTVDALLDQVSGVRTTTEGEVFFRGGRAGEVSYVADGIPINEVYIAGEIVKSALNADFLIKRKETVLSNGGPVRVAVAAWTLSAELDNFTRPIARPAVYRVAQLTNQQEAPLLQGEISLFAGPDYLGRLRLDRVIAPGQKFELPFGADPHMTVKREVIKYQETKRGGKIRINREIKISLNNHSQGERKLKVEDLIPVSQDSRVKIRVEDLTPKPSKMAENGKVEWEFTIQPGQAMELVVPYNIEYKAGTRVIGL